MTVPVRRGGLRYTETCFEGGKIVVEVIGDLPTSDDWLALAQGLKFIAAKAPPRKLTWADLGLPKPGTMRAGDIWGDAA